jgi:hypothetical protein
MIVVYNNKTDADTICKAIEILPSGIYVWYSLDGENNLIQYAQSVDGRCAMSANFTPEDIAVWGAYPQITLMENLPTDWQYPQF